MSKYIPKYPEEPWLDTILPSGLPRWVDELGLQADGPPLTPLTFREFVQDNRWLRDWITKRFAAGYSASMVSVQLGVPSSVWRPERLTPVVRFRRDTADPRAAAWDRQLCQWSDMPNAWAHTLLRERTLDCSESNFIKHFKELRKELHNVDTGNVEERRLAATVRDDTDRSVLDPRHDDLALPDPTESSALFDPDAYLLAAETADTTRTEGSDVVVPFKAKST